MGRLTTFLCTSVIWAGAVSQATAQSPAMIQKVWTPEQKSAQAAYAKYEADRTSFKTKAQAALSAETAHEKELECPNAQSTRESEECLNAEILKTQQNYSAFSGAIRSMLGMHAPTWPGELSSAVSGPEGTPPTPEQEVASFDRIEHESKSYRQHAEEIAYQQFQGGTLAPVFELESQLKLQRLHMQELAFVYGELLSNH